MRQEGGGRKRDRIQCPLRSLCTRTVNIYIFSQARVVTYTLKNSTLFMLLWLYYGHINFFSVRHRRHHSRHYDHFHHSHHHYYYHYYYLKSSTGCITSVQTKLAGKQHSSFSDFSVRKSLLQFFPW